MNFYYVEQAPPHAPEESNVYNPSSSFYNDQDQENNSVDIKSFLKLTFCVLMVIMCLSFSVYFSETFLVSSKKDPNSSLYGMISAYFFNEIPFSSFRYLAEDIYKSQAAEGGANGSDTSNTFSGGNPFAGGNFDPSNNPFAK